mmetsp:Transcript_17148/g.57935  ORF Transcript_17148/g.57935 Transcript_17148/m.57935 type:complete len:203 (+) Transcript_17148:2481-3089(+)
MIEVRRRRRLCSLARAVHEHVGVRLRGVLVRGGGAVFVVGVDFVLQILIGATFLKVAQLRLGKALAAVGASPRGKPGRGAVPLHKEPIPVAHDELVDAVAVLAGEAPPEPRPREGRALPRLGARGDRDALAAVRAGGSRALCGRSAVVRGGGGGGGVLFLLLSLPLVLVRGVVFFALGGAVALQAAGGGGCGGIWGVRLIVV